MHVFLLSKSYLKHKCYLSNIYDRKIKLEALGKPARIKRAFVPRIHKYGRGENLSPKFKHPALLGLPAQAFKGGICAYATSIKILWDGPNFDKAWQYLNTILTDFQKRICLTLDKQIRELH